MIDPYPGESLEVYDAADGADFGLLSDVYSRTSPGRTITSGDVWRFWHRSDYQTGDRYLDDAGADVVVSWVLEVASGSGTLAASEGVDPAGGDPDATAPTSLGSFTVTGPGTVVIPSALMDATQIVDGDPGGRNMLRLEATAGSVDVAQVKIRVWPVGGALGGWSDILPGFATDPVLPFMQGAFISRSTVDGPSAAYPAAWAGAMGDLASGSSTGGTGPHTLTPFVVGSTSSGGVTWRRAAPTVSPYIDVVTSIGTSTAVVSGTPHGFIAAIQGAPPDGEFGIAPGLVDGVDYVRPPTEIPADTGYFTQPEGDPTTGWLNPTATVTMFGGGPTPLDAGPSIASEATDTSPVVSGQIVRDQVEGTPAVTIDATDTIGAVPLDDTGQWVVVYASHSMASTQPAYPGVAPFTGDDGWDFIYEVSFGEGTPGPDFAPMKTFVNMPPYRVWLAAAAVVRKVRQFHRDDGLGVTPPRAFGGASRIRTGRAYGYD